MTKTVKILTCLLLVFTVVALPLTVAINNSNIANADTANAIEVTWDSWAVLSDFVGNYPLRGFATDNEINAGNYIKNKFIEMGLSVKSQQIMNYKSYNHIATIDVGATKKIVIGAHYDNVMVDGATDNGSGVATLLILAEQLLQRKDLLRYNVEFVAFGGEEAGLYGSLAYCANAENDVKNIALMINIDSIASGDKLYIYGEDKNTNYQKLFYQSANGASTQLYNKPLYKDIAYGIDVWGRGYYHTAQSSDHTPFRNLEIPTLFYYSGNYDTLFGNYVESKNVNNCVANTSKDTLQHLESMGKAVVVAKLDTVVQSVVGAFVSSDFQSVIENASNELVWKYWKNTYFAMIGVGVLLVVLMIFSVIYYKKLDKQSVMGYAEARGTHNKVFGAPDADDIFDIKNKKK